MKRIFDFLVSAVCLLLFSPLMVLVGIAIKFDSDGSVFYRGTRVGRYGKPFKMFKFRTMVKEAEKIGASSTSEEDPRVTRVGRVLRKYKIDELPQLINVLRGDMSIVGPRPEVQKFVDLYTEEQKDILKVRPGITDWASIMFHNEGEIIQASEIKDADEAYAKLIRPQKLRLQLIYVDKHNIWTDIRIMICTILTVFSTRLGGKPIGVPRTESTGDYSTKGQIGF